MIGDKYILKKPISRYIRGGAPAGSEVEQVTEWQPRIKGNAATPSCADFKCHDGIIRPEYMSNLKGWESRENAGWVYIIDGSVREKLGEVPRYKDEARRGICFYEHAE